MFGHPPPAALDGEGATFAVVLVPILWVGRQMQCWERRLLLAGYIAYVVSLWST